MKNLKYLVARFYADYLSGDRVHEYETLLTCALDHNYRCISVSDFSYLVRNGSIHKDQRYLILRHDIDSDTSRARRFVLINKKLNVRSTFYLRLSTFDRALVTDILNAGLDLGYHFEELNDAAIENGWSSAVDVEIQECRQQFMKNLKYLREKYLITIENVCSHGEFANRSLGVTNNYFLDDKFLTEAGIHIDAYSPELRDAIDAFVSDTFPPQKYIPNDPKIYFKSGTPVVQILVHPRHWGSSPLSNAKLDTARIYNGFKYFINKILK